MAVRVACATECETARRLCEVNACFSELRAKFPNSTRLGAERWRARADNSSSCGDRRCARP
jgi:hypothetical protein